jgi:pyruvate dehydrogenase E2 component (dihydrolipoamide acetyltransferase)
VVAPCVFDCESKDVAAIASERADLAARAPLNKLTVREMSGATFTVSNLGRRGSALHAHRGAADDGDAGAGAHRGDVGGARRAVVAGQVIGLSLTVDHRASTASPRANS